MSSLEQLALIWLSVYLSSLLAAKTKLTPVLYFLACGAALVNLDLLPREADGFIRGLAEVGIIIIMFALGFEESPSNFIRSIKRSWGIAFFGAVAPFAVAYGVAEYYWENTGISIMCGLAMTATAVSLTMVSLKSAGLQASPAATGIMTSAVLDDMASLALVAILVPVATGDAAADLLSIGLVLIKAVAFFVVISVMGMVIFPHEVPRLRRLPIIGRHGIKHLLGVEKGKQATLVVLLMALAIGILAHYFGFHPAVGAYMTGLILKEEFFNSDDLPDTNYYADTKKIVDNVAFSWIGPVFFVHLGTQLVFDWEVLLSIIPQAIMMTVGLFIAQVASAALAARYTGGFSFEESMMIGFGMLGRAELAFVVMDIAYVQHQILSTEAFYTLMVAAFWLNLAVPITISLWKPFLIREHRSKQVG